MKLKSLEITNFRCFETLKINFEDQLTVIVAENGVGKTAVLDAIAIAISPFIGAFSFSKKKDIHPDDVRVTNKNFGEINVNYPVKLEVIGAFLDQEETWAREKSSLKGRATIKDAKNIIAYGKQLEQFSNAQGFINFPVIRYYGICRLCKEIPPAIPKQHPRKYAERVSGYINCLESSSNFSIFQDWFIAISHASFQYEQAIFKQQEWEDSRKKAGEHWLILRDTVQETINVALKRTGWQNIEYDATLQKIVMTHAELGTLGVNQLSSGIRTMVGLIADLAYRAIKLNPHLKENSVKETEGIVLIDEIELHLHPSWQQTVLSDLQKTFPKIQFIVTTHSPQVLTTIKRENIRVLGKNSEGKDIAQIPLAHSYGEPSNDVLQAIMHVDPQPPVPEKQQLERLTSLVDQGHYANQEAQKLLQELKQKLNTQHPQIAKIERSIRRQEALKG